MVVLQKSIDHDFRHFIASGRCISSSCVPSWKWMKRELNPVVGLLYYPVRFEIFLYKLADNSHIAHINCNMMNTHIIIYINIVCPYPTSSWMSSMLWWHSWRAASLGAWMRIRGWDGWLSDVDFGLTLSSSDILSTQTDFSAWHNSWWYIRLPQAQLLSWRQ